jgi:hypothetical protein
VDTWRIWRIKFGKSVSQRLRDACSSAGARAQLLASPMQRLVCKPDPLHDAGGHVQVMADLAAAAEHLVTHDGRLPRVHVEPTDEVVLPRGALALVTAVVVHRTLRHVQLAEVAQRQPLLSRQLVQQRLSSNQNRSITTRANAKCGQVACMRPRISCIYLTPRPSPFTAPMPHSAHFVHVGLSRPSNARRCHSARTTRYLLAAERVYGVTVAAHASAHVVVVGHLPALKRSLAEAVHRKPLA